MSPKLIEITHEEGMAINRAIYVLNTKQMKGKREDKIIRVLNNLLERLRAIT